MCNLVNMLKSMYLQGMHMFVQGWVILSQPCCKGLWLRHRLCPCFYRESASMQICCIFFSSRTIGTLIQCIFEPCNRTIPSPVLNCRSPIFSMYSFGISISYMLLMGAPHTAIIPKFERLPSGKTEAYAV